MPKLVTPNKLIKAIKKLGFEKTRVKGSHHRFKHRDGRKATIPVHGNEPICPGLLNKIIREDLKMDKKEFWKNF